MIKQSIRLSGFILAVFALILVFKHSYMTQGEKPLGTTERFELIQVYGDKDRLINELNAMVDQYDAVLVKIVPNPGRFFFFLFFCVQKTHLPKHVSTAYFSGLVVPCRCHGALRFWLKTYRSCRR